MTEIRCAAHFGYVSRDEIGGATVAATGEDERLAAESVARSVGPGELDAADDAVGARVQRADSRVEDKWDSCLIRGLTQPIGRPCMRRAE